VSTHQVHCLAIGLTDRRVDDGRGGLRNVDSVDGICGDLHVVKVTLTQLGGNRILGRDAPVR
jgi:hypothetical protein